jgi:hypothetical protein
MTSLGESPIVPLNAQGVFSFLSFSTYLGRPMSPLLECPLIWADGKREGGL